MGILNGCAITFPYIYNFRRSNNIVYRWRLFWDAGKKILVKKPFFQGENFFVKSIFINLEKNTQNPIYLKLSYLLSPPT